MIAVHWTVNIRPLTTKISAHSWGHGIGWPSQGSKAVIAAFIAGEWRLEDRLKGWQLFSGTNQLVNMFFTDYVAYFSLFVTCFLKTKQNLSEMQCKVHS
jgi:hypothetical protein